MTTPHRDRDWTDWMDWTNVVEFSATVPVGDHDVAILGIWSKKPMGFTGMRMPYKITVHGSCAPHFDIVDVLVNGRSQHLFVGEPVPAESLPTQLQMGTCPWGTNVELVVRCRANSAMPLVAILSGQAF